LLLFFLHLSLGFKSSMALTNSIYVLLLCTSAIGEKNLQYSFLHA
jgi:hypothetical protein